jgi:hypothetical protein
MLGAQARPEGGPLERSRSRPPERPFLRSERGRPPDSRERAFEVLDEIERGSPEEERLADLVEAAQAGDPFAFAELYVALFDRVHRWLQVALKDREDAQDAAQQVFLRAFEALPRYKEIRGFRPWVFSIARNLAYDRLHAASASTHPMDPALLAERRERMAEQAPRAEAGGDDGAD